MIGIDTVKYKVHLYEDKLSKIDNLQNTEDLITMLNKSEYISMGHMRFARSKNLYSESKVKEFAKGKLTSASYEINFDYSITEQILVFEYSIPKYWFGTNIENFPKDSTKCIYSELLRSIKQFLLFEFKIEVQEHRIELMRIDYCYNYIFQSIENKDSYKNILYDRFNSVFTDGKSLAYENNNTIMYKTRNFSFKVYDKGAEFEKHDYKKMHKHYNETTAKKYQNIADKTLRFEITVRKNKICEMFYSEYDKLSQNSTHSKSAFRPIKKNYNLSMSLLTRLERQFEKLRTCKTSDIESVKIKINEICDDEKYNIKHKEIFSNHPATYIRLMLENRKQPKFRIDYKDLKVVLSRLALKDFAKYQEIITPKKCFFGLTKWQRTINKYGYSEIIKYDKELNQVVINKFKEFLLSINPSKTQKLSTLRTLKHLEKKTNFFFCCEKNFNLNSLIKFVSNRDNLPKKQFQQIYNRSTIHRNEKKLKLIQLSIEKQLPNSQFGTYKIDVPEIINLEKLK